jgi:hypothetical protein
MAEKKLVAEVDLPEETAERFEAFVEKKCLDRDKWLKNLLLGGIERVRKQEEPWKWRRYQSSSG